MEKPHNFLSLPPKVVFNPLPGLELVLAHLVQFPFFGLMTISLFNPLQNVEEAPVALLAEPLRIQRSQLRILERLGRGQYGDVHVCHHLDSPSSSLVAVKSLESNAPRVLR